MLALASIWNVLIAIGCGLVVAWVALVITLIALRPEGSVLKDALRIFPDTVRLLRRIGADRTVPRAVRLRLYLLFVYLASPIDLIPDFLPVIGPLDDVVVAVLVLRYVRRRLGEDELRRRWLGTDDGYALLQSILR